MNISIPFGLATIERLISQYINMNGNRAGRDTKKIVFAISILDAVVVFNFVTNTRHTRKIHFRYGYSILYLRDSNVRLKLQLKKLERSVPGEFTLVNFFFSCVQRFIIYCFFLLETFKLS